jgi:hypothetical protein
MGTGDKAAGDMMPTIQLGLVWRLMRTGIRPQLHISFMAWNLIKDRGSFIFGLYHVPTTSGAYPFSVWLVISQPGVILSVK